MRDEAFIREKYEALPDAERWQYALISLKIKRFRTFNRIYGREAGDALIEKVYEIVAGWLGEGEYIAHIRVDYFNVLLRFPREFNPILDKIIELNACIRDMDDPRFHGRVFCGFGIYPLEAGVDFYTAQYNADVARTECPEREFRNSHMEVYGVTVEDKDARYYDLIDIIKPALERGDFKLYLQPKVDLRTGEVHSAEALMRWIDPVRGMLNLGDFLPMLEETGLIGDVDGYLFEQVCKSINRWREVYGKKIQISVNLSAALFNFRDFFKVYRGVHKRYGTPTECIEFEVLESIVLNEVERVRHVVNELKDYGFTSALDDFGSGYSSYSVLTSAEIHTLKIDRSLFRHEEDERERIIIRHIIQTARELGMRTVAEGVETQGYVDYLRSLGCDYIQGYVFYKPMPVDEFEERFVRGDEKVHFEH
ncbi:bifunctional diguanylate cyclase/phosphodiesterase [Pseudoflavonifractor phocaeensis]|uniref:bifunctional diguanylate cyclase/phosphodiesterase n=1 Tax=Pseudoflavonifractor phocaeensis TaxID=1870988 RepID=UPI002741CF4B|nr:bifunctional diguanylate cyclase/phosphodiesterase [Pseudoflavonifractor phocaeensis]